MNLVLSVLLLVAAANIVLVEAGLPVCYPTDNYKEEAATAFLYKPPSFPKRCQDGPAYSVYGNKDEFYWPPIYKGSCEALDCGYLGSPCITRKSVWRTKCVLVHKIKKGYWVNIGYRTIRYLDDVKCSCKECRDIKDHGACVNTKSCPNDYYHDVHSYNPKSYCFWSKRGCDCCQIHSCPRGQYFNKALCSCYCPSGTIWRGNRCIRKIIRPVPVTFGTCEHQRSVSNCLRTRCSERRNSPYCVVDSYSKKCRCPECEDQKTPELCLHTYCGPNQQCNYDKRTHQCFCPFKDYRNYQRKF